MAVNSILRAFAPAAKVTLPVGTGYLFLGAAYGIYMHVNGFSVWYPALMAWLIYGGSLEFVAASMLLSPFAPVTTFFFAFMIQARHLFYGLAMLDRFKGLGWKKFYLIFGMSDETFALEFATKAPAGVDSSWYMMWITFLDRMYWLGGAVLGATLGSFLTFDTKGLSFVMTAMFVVIFPRAVPQRKASLDRVDRVRGVAWVPRDFWARLLHDPDHGGDSAAPHRFPKAD